MTKPLAIDLYAGLGGWTDGLLAEGWRVVGFDIERHVYGAHAYRAQLVVQDVLTLHGSQFKDAELIVASPPCQFFSYTSMPWSKAKALAAKVRADPFLLEKELALFKACFRIQREANQANGCNERGDCLECDGTGNFYRHDEDGDFLECDHCSATGRPRKPYIPLIVENVRGAEPWVGRANWKHGSFYLWGQVPALMPIAMRVSKVQGFRFDGSGRSFQSASVRRTAVGNEVPFTSRDCGIESGLKMPGINLAEIGFNVSAARRYAHMVSGAKYERSAEDKRQHIGATRKMASAMIAKIPEPLSRHIARTYYPRPEA